MRLIPPNRQLPMWTNLMNAQHPTDHAPIAITTCRRSPHCGPPQSHRSSQFVATWQYASAVAAASNGLARHRGGELIVTHSQWWFGRWPSTTSVGAPLYLRSWGFQSRCRRQERMRLRRAMCTPPSITTWGPICCRAICTSGRSRQTVRFPPTGPLRGSTRQWEWIRCFTAALVIGQVHQREQQVSRNTRVVRPRDLALHFAEALAF